MELIERRSPEASTFAVHTGGKTPHSSAVRRFLERVTVVVTPRINNYEHLDKDIAGEIAKQRVEMRIFYFNRFF